jgi:V8-like Glu-specific endopeptidase
MGLLTMEECDQFIAWLFKLPNILDPEVRRQLLIDMPESLKVKIADSGVPQTHLISIVTIANENSLELYEGVWPILQLLRRAIIGFGTRSPFGRRLQSLFDLAQRRSEQWETWSNTFEYLAPQESFHLERLISAAMGLHNPVDWRERMYQAELATCLIQFKGYAPEEQGTGFLVAPNILMTNYHVMEDLVRRQMKPKDVLFSFDYKTSHGSFLKKPGECHLAPSWHLDSSPTHHLDYILLALNESPGQEEIDQHGLRGWLKPKKHSFQTGEPLFIVQHPNGEPLKFAFDRAKSANNSRISYLTNTGNGSSGAPCFDLNWDLVALHQGVVPPEIDPQQPNMGVPFARILEQPGFTRALASAATS